MDRKLFYLFELGEMIMASVQDVADAVAKVSGDVDVLIQAQGDKIDPAALDPIVASLSDISAKLEAAVAPQ